MGPGSRNAAAIAAYGYSREEFLTLSAADIRPPDDVEPDSHHGETATLRHQLKSGEVFLVQTTAQPVEWKGLRAEFVTVRDVSRAGRRSLPLNNWPSRTPVSGSRSA